MNNLLGIDFKSLEPDLQYEIRGLDRLLKNPLKSKKYKVLFKSPVKIIVENDGITIKLKNTESVIFNKEDFRKQNIKQVYYCIKNKKTNFCSIVHFNIKYNNLLEYFNKEKEYININEFDSIEFKV